MELKVSSDSSISAYNSAFDECYHSLRDGALSETLYKHIIPAFRTMRDLQEVCILDICFGLGYNTLASLYYRDLHQPSMCVRIFSPELDNILLGQLVSFTYPQEFVNLAREVIPSLVQQGVYEDDRTYAQVSIIDACAYVQNFEDVSFDVVYQDAFSPKKNPELWSEEYFSQLYRILKPNGIITTYSQSSLVRKNALSCGFRVYDCKSIDSPIRAGSVMSKLPLEIEGYTLKRYYGKEI